MTSILKACEVAPAAYSTEVTSSLVSKENDLTYDVGNLAAFDTHPFNFVSEDDLRKYARENIQLLINQIFDLPSESSENGKCAILPEGETVVPREKPLPKPKVETRWEKFAKDKGIQKRKKGRMVYDENTGEYAARWGYKRANDDLKDWAIELKSNEDIYKDSFSERQEEKKSRVDKNKRQFENNLAKGRGKQQSRTPTGIPVELTETDNNKLKQRGKEGTKKTLEKVQFATASMGKFDSRRNDEPERKRTGKRNHFDPVVGKEKSENERGLSILDKILGKEDYQGKRKGHSNDTEEKDENPAGKKKRKGMKMKKVTRGQNKRRR